MNTKPLSIHNEKNNIRCVLYSNDVPVRHAVVCCHGFAGHKGNRAAARFAEYMLSKYKDMAVLCFDWPCHGEDVKKKFCLSDCDTYLGAVIRYVREVLCAEKTDCYATSFGAYLALSYVAKHGDPFRMIAMRSPAVNMYDVLCSLLTDTDHVQLAKGKDVLMGFDRKIAVSPAVLAELKEEDITAFDYSGIADSIRSMHGEKDEVVPFSASREFAERNGIDLIAFPNADHRFSDYKLMTEAIQYVEAFFEG